MRKFKLIERIIELSVASTWDQAKLEWKVHRLYFDDERQRCLCGKYPIIEICSIRNNKNGNFAVVGNCCVKRFLGLSSDKIFQGLRRIRKDDAKALNAEAVEHAYQQGWMNDYERKFCLDTMRNQRFTLKQRAKRIQINQKVLREARRLCQ
jgi:hypothetical protein